MPEEKKKLTPEERKKIADQIAALQKALEEQEEASGAEASADASEEVEEQRERLAALFTRLDISEEDYDLLAGAFAAGTEERTREIVREELAAEEEGATPPEPPAEPGSVAELNADPDAPPVPPPPDDSQPPPSQHWSEKRLWGKGEEA